jgi:oxygen-independent coproporphyrinogen-3 oxidase
MFSAFKKAGINRASIGIQSFDNELLQTLTREHSAEKAQEAIFDAYNSGIENITIDLMYEIPGQTRASWTKSLDTATKLPISHLSLYNLTFEEGTAFYRRRNALKLLLPSDNDAVEMLLEAIDTLQAHGFSQYEISAFARDNLYSHHNTGYWLGREFLGFGPSAFSYFGGKRFRNVENLKTYFEKCSQKILPMDFEEELSPEGKIRELFTINLRLNAGIAVNEFQARHGTLPKELEETLDALSQEGFIKKGERVALTERGRLFFNEVAPRLI